MNYILLSSALAYAVCNGTLAEPFEHCDDLQQKYVSSLEKIKILEEENKLLKAVSSCRDGWIQGNGSCYNMPNQKRNWYDARALCQQLGAHLTVIGTSEEEKIVSDIIKRAKKYGSEYEGISYVWLGGFDGTREGNWHWVTGEPFEYTNWRFGNPDNNHPGSGEDCMDWSNGWNDNYCGRDYYFLCEM